MGNIYYNLIIFILGYCIGALTCYLCYIGGKLQRKLFLLSLIIILVFLFTIYFNLHLLREIPFK